MKLNRLWWVAVLLLGGLTPCYAHHMAVIVNPGVKAADVTDVYLAKLFRSETTKWPDGQAVILVLHKNSPGEAQTLTHLLNLSFADFKSLMAAHQDLLIDGSDADVLEKVRSTPGAVGLVEVHSVDKTVKVVRVNGKFPNEAGYLPH